jgi:hypothetical protein
LINFTLTWGKEKKMKINWGKPALFVAAAAAAVTLSNPAAAALFTYNQTNGDILTIDNTNNIGALKGSNIDVTFTSADFASFTGGANPSGLTFVLATLDGTRTVRGVAYTDNPSHTQKLIFGRNGRTNLWSYWGNPVVAGDYITYIGGYTPPTEVPAPGVMGLFGIGLAGLWMSRRRRKTIKAQALKANAAFA